MNRPRTSLRPKTAVTKRFVASVVRDDTVPSTPLDDPDKILGFWREVIARQTDYEPDKETLAVILLTARLRPFAWHRVSVGTLNETTAHPREILRPVLIGAAHSFALVHNHPSGNPSPSMADSALTKRIDDAATLMQVRLVDHVIVTDPTQQAGDGSEPWFSFKESGLI